MADFFPPKTLQTNELQYEIDTATGPTLFMVTLIISGAFSRLISDDPACASEEI